MADPRRRLLLFFCCGLHVYCCVHRTHTILGNTRRASRERELLELRILHERQHLVHSERWPVPGLFRRQTHSHCARSFAPCSHMHGTKFAITCIHVRMADPVRTGFKPPREVDWLNAHSIQIGSMRIQCGRNQCAFDVQCGQALSFCCLGALLVVIHFSHS